MTNNVQVIIHRPDGKEMTIIMSKDGIIDALYPDLGMRGISKGYINLVNFIYEDTSAKCNKQN